MIQEVKDGTGSWGAHYPSDLFAGLSAGTPPSDSDDDGMPDDWESASGLDPNDPSDSSQSMPSGYTAIEEYINQKADELAGGSGGSSGSRQQRRRRTRGRLGLRLHRAGRARSR